MDLKESLESLLLSINLTCEFNIDSCSKELETMYPDALQVLKKDSAFFDKERILFGINISEYADTYPPEVWESLQKCMMASLFHGDPKEKISNVMNTVKSLWSSSGETNDDVDRILNDEETNDKIWEFFNYVSELRTAKMFMDILEEIDISSLGISIDNPTDLMNMVRDTEHPTTKKVINTVHRLLKDRLERGQFTQQQIVSDIEGVKAKIQSLFGSI